MTTETLIITGGHVLQLGQDPGIIEANIRVNCITGKITRNHSLCRYVFSRT